jgi:hypothetical protein
LDYLYLCSDAVKIATTAAAVELSWLQWELQVIKETAKRDKFKQCMDVFRKVHVLQDKPCTETLAFLLLIIR